MHYAEEINMKFGGEGTRLYSTAGTGFKKICMQNDLHLLDASVQPTNTDGIYGNPADAKVLPNLDGITDTAIFFNDATADLENGSARTQAG